MENIAASPSLVSTSRRADIAANPADPPKRGPGRPPKSEIAAKARSIVGTPEWLESASPEQFRGGIAAAEREVAEAFAAAQAAKDRSNSLKANIGAEVERRCADFEKIQAQLAALKSFKI